MNVLNINNMIKGWFVGNIIPTALTTKECEVAYKEYLAGDYDKKHYHKIATEVTLIVRGTVEMNGITYSKNDIIVINPGEATDFKALEDSATVVVKVPGANNDKYMVDNE
jgi:quercetin dioxygenase-like cupin family protein